MNIFYKIKQTFEAKSAYWAANYPKAWSLGWLTQICVASILFLLTFLVSLIIPVSAIDTPDVMTWYYLGYIPTIFWMIFIIYRLIKYNTEKLYGDRTGWHNFIELPTYILQLLLPLLIPAILGCVLATRIGSVIEDEKLDANANSFEQAQPFFTFDFGSSNYMYQDAYSTRRHYQDEDYYEDYDYLNEMYKYFENDERYYHYIISERSRDEEENTIFELLDDNYRESALDSLVKYRNQMKDSIAFHKGVFEKSRPKLYPYRFYEFYNDDYFYDYRYEDDYNNEFTLNQDSIKQLYFFEHYKDESFVAKKYDELLLTMRNMGIDDVSFTTPQLMNLYRNNIYYAVQNVLKQQVTLFDKQTNLLKEQINYIKKCKERHFFFIYDLTIYQMFFGLVFGLSLMLCLFKNMSWVEFLVGLFCVCLLPTLLGICMAVMRWNEYAVTLTFWGIFLILIIWGIVERRRGMRRKRGAILLMIPHLFMAYLPIALLATMTGVFHFWEWDYFDRYLIHVPTKYDPNYMVYSADYWYIREHSVAWAVIFGYAAYLLVLYPLWIKRDWLKFIAKPKKA